jgi:hypothetical protein
MNKSLYLFQIVAGVYFSVGRNNYYTGKGFLVDEKGDVVTGYSTVIIDNGLAYPVRNLETSIGIA